MATETRPLLNSIARSLKRCSCWIGNGEKGLSRTKLKGHVISFSIFLEKPKTEKIKTKKLMKKMVLEEREIRLWVLIQRKRRKKDWGVGVAMGDGEKKKERKTGFDCVW